MRFLDVPDIPYQLFCSFVFCHMWSSVCLLHSLLVLCRWIRTLHLRCVSTCDKQDCCGSRIESVCLKKHIMAAEAWFVNQECW